MRYPLSAKKCAACFIGLLAFCFMTPASAQDDFEDFRKAQMAEFNQFKEEKLSEFEAFRLKCNQEFASFIRKPWKPQETKPKQPKPVVKEVPPVVYSDKEPIQFITTPQPIKDVLKVQPPKPQPMPIRPIEELPKTKTPTYPTKSFVFFGTSGKVRIDEEAGLMKLNGLSEDDIADAWLALSTNVYQSLLHDCLKMREDLQLCDWAYLLMLQEMAKAVYPNSENDATLLMAYAYCQSGYKMRLAQANNKLFMLYACDYSIYDKPYLTLDGEKYYFFAEGNPTVRLCEAKFPQEKIMSLEMPRSVRFAWNASDTRNMKSRDYQKMQFDVVCNKNIIDFYANYPDAEYGGNFMTRWAMYANTPFEEGIKETLYPELRSLIQGLSEKEAASRLLNWVQTSLTYRLDDQVWGGDRAFFPEESLYYPYADCEDRSILFTRLVRDLLGLKCILVYYPGHLACAVNFKEKVNGDYFTHNGENYVVCDPTYIAAGIGITMPSMRGKETTVILLEN